MKIKEENNRLKEENQRAHMELQKKNEMLKKAEKMVIEALNSHISSLPSLDAVVKAHKLRICDEKRFSEFLTLISNLICQTPQSSNPSNHFVPPRTPVGAGNQIFTANQILTRNSNINIIQSNSNCHSLEK